MHIHQMYKTNTTIATTYRVVPKRLEKFSLREILQTTKTFLSEKFSGKMTGKYTPFLRTTPQSKPPTARLQPSRLRLPSPEFHDRCCRIQQWQRRRRRAFTKVGSYPLSFTFYFRIFRMCRRSHISLWEFAGHS